MIADRSRKGSANTLRSKQRFIPAQPAFHRAGMTHVDERAGDDDPIKTTQSADDLVGVALSEHSTCGASAEQVSVQHTTRFTTNSWFRLRRVRVLGLGKTAQKKPLARKISKKIVPAMSPHVLAMSPQCPRDVPTCLRDVSFVPKSSHGHPAYCPRREQKAAGNRTLKTTKV